MRKEILTGILSLSAIIIISSFFTGCASSANLWGDTEEGLIMTYRMEQNQMFDYRFAANYSQVMEMMGREIKVETTNEYLFSTLVKENSNGNHKLTFTIDSMSMNVKSPQGEMSPDVSSVFGKQFDMTLSELGIEKDIAGADKITYAVGPGGDKSIKSDFATLFPNLPGRPIKPGETWKSKDTVNIEDGGMQMIILLESENKLTGYEKMNGKECAKISAKVTGKLEGKGSQRGIEMVLEGTVEGNDVWYFDYKNGQFMKITSEAVTEAKIEGKGPQSMTIPMHMNVKTETTLL